MKIDGVAMGSAQMRCNPMQPVARNR
jgi:hypothetical protein